MYTVFYVNVVLSIGQVDKMEFDEIGQRVMCDYSINCQDVHQGLASGIGIPFDVTIYDDAYSLSPTLPS